MISRLLRCLLPAALFLLPIAANAAPLQPVDSVNPFVGTDAHGHTYPGATVPFGMVQLSPDTRTESWDGCSGYHYDDTVIQGFSHTHLSGTGGAGLGDILLMPSVGEVHLDAGQPGSGYASRFSHSKEVAHPGYYRVYLQDPQVIAELTATARCGFHRYTFPAADQAHIVVDLDHNIGNGTLDSQVMVENATTLSGYRRSDGWGGRRIVYYVMQFSRPFDSLGIEKDGQRLPDGTTEASGGKVKAFATYKTKAGESVLVKVGISGTSIAGARKNLAVEIPGWGFDGVRTAAETAWDQALSAVAIDTPDPHLRATFYTGLYHAYLAPVLYNDVDGTYRGMDHQSHTGATFQNYTTFSLWDIYRAEAPLLTILQPGRVNDMVQSLLAEYQQNGQHTVPIWPLWDNETWCMIGYHSADIIADAYLKGFRGYDAEVAYQALRDTAMQNRQGLAGYKKLGYVPSSQGAAATSRTIEYAYDDWCLARMAEALGHQDDARLFYQRAGNYRSLFDGTVHFFRGRKADGSWRVPFVNNGLVNDEYTEADAWQYAFGVQHDIPGLIALYGGDAGFVQRLDALFAADSTIHTNIPDISGRVGQYSQGDEQCHHVAYLYDYAGAPYKTQYRVRQVMTTLYDDTPTGLCGNDDCGQMSAWYVLSALGVYPVNPDSGVYAIGSPLVSKAVLHLDAAKYHGRTFTVIADNNGPKNVYIQSATLNGKTLGRAWLTHTELTSGGTLHLVMGPNANVAWGREQSARPPATMPVGIAYAAVPAPSSDRPVALSLPIRVVCGSDDPVETFVSDPNMVEGDTNGSQTPIDTSAAPNAAPAAVYQSERYAQDFTYTFPVPRSQTYTVRLHFAEIFDDGAGQRVEDIAINGRPALKNFDIFAAAGGRNRAVVKEFTAVRPDDRGNIAIRIAASPNSPDQNAKISGIEILPDTNTTP